MEKVDVLLPPAFKPSGVIKSRQSAITDGDWIGTFNLWILQSDPIPSIIYQQRSPNSTWEPNKLDVSVGGHYQAGEKMGDGLREAEEELGCKYDPSQLTYLGRKLNVNTNIHGNICHYVTEIFFIIDNSALETYDLQKDEVTAIFSCPIPELFKVHTSQYSFNCSGLDAEKKPCKITVNAEVFPYNWDAYHFKIALLAERFLKGEANILY